MTRPSTVRECALRIIELLDKVGDDVLAKERELAEAVRNVLALPDLDTVNANPSLAVVEPDQAGTGWLYQDGDVRIIRGFGVMQAAPDRVASAVLQQTIGASDNRQAFYDMFDSWAQEIASDHTEANEETWRAFRSRMYDGDFVFAVDRDFVRSCEIPMLVLMGDDLYHPQATSREIAELAPMAELVERWKEEDVVRETVARVRSFLEANTP